MKRAPIVLTGTACGLVAVVGYHAATPRAALTSGTSGTGNALNVGVTSSSSAATARAATTAKSSATAGSTAKTPTSSAATTRSATGSDVQYPYGDLEVEVTMTAGRITNVTVVRHDVTDPRSEMIDQYAIPQLRSQAISAQSAKIDGVSGASYTSAAYEQSLQSAIDKLKA